MTLALRFNRHFESPFTEDILSRQSEGQRGEGGVVPDAHDEEKQIGESSQSHGVHRVVEEGVGGEGVEVSMNFREVPRGICMFPDSSRNLYVPEHTDSSRRSSSRNLYVPVLHISILSFDVEVRPLPTDSLLEHPRCTLLSLRAQTKLWFLIIDIRVMVVYFHHLLTLSFLSALSHESMVLPLQSLSFLSVL